MSGESIRLAVNGCVNTRWTEWSVDSDILVPADAFDLALYATQRNPIPDEVEEGAPCTLHLDGDLVLTGHIDDIDSEVSRGGHSIRINGRDIAAALTDCSAPLLHAAQIGLQDIVERIARPLGVTKSRIAAHALRERVQVEPGQTAWGVIRRVADAAGLWPWMEPDGTLVIDKPDYQRPSVGQLRLRYDGAGNNVSLLRIRRSAATRYSEVTVLGQHASLDPESWTTNRTALHGRAVDTRARSKGIHRPYVVVDPTCESQQQADQRAQDLLDEGTRDAFEALAVVPGWRAPDGTVWAPGRQVEVMSEPHGIDETYFIRGRRLSLSRSRGRQTELRLCAVNAWMRR